jgi:hypothetical protein
MARKNRPTYCAHVDCPEVCEKPEQIAPKAGCPACGHRRPLTGEIQGERTCQPCADRYEVAPPTV